MSADGILVIIFGVAFSLWMLAGISHATTNDPFYEVVVGMRDAFGKIWGQIRRLWPRRRTTRSRYDERRVAALEEECRDSVQVFIDWIDRELAAEEAFRRPKQARRSTVADWNLHSETEYDQC